MPTRFPLPRRRTAYNLGGKSLSYTSDTTIVLPPPFRERLIKTIRERLPQKSFGYLLSAGNPRTAEDFLLFEGNLRNDDEWQGRFHAYGQYFVDHDDAGFVATPEETWRLQKEIWRRGLVEVGVFHSHLRHPGNFSQIDYEMHLARFHNLWHLIVSMRNPELPQVRAFAASRAGVRELVLTPDGGDSHEPSAVTSQPDEPARDQAIMQARQVLKLDETGRPKCKDSRALYTAIRALLRTECDEAVQELLVEGFLRSSAQLYEEYVAQTMRPLAESRYLMGSTPEQSRFFCDERPAHEVELSPFSLAQVPVTNELFGLFDPRRLDAPARDRRKPAVDLTWFDAAVFAMWVGCRLPTEAEWEFACGAGSASDWCCDAEELLPRHAWYSVNSGGETHPVGTLEANALGLFDLHGNVWEWCRDSYDQDFYSRSPVANPVSHASFLTDKVTRGGSMHALSEMCRTRYRFHEPPDFRASDLGFRLAKGGITTSSQGGRPWSRS